MHLYSALLLLACILQSAAGCPVLLFIFILWLHQLDPALECAVCCVCPAAQLGCFDKSVAATVAVFVMISQLYLVKTQAGATPLRFSRAMKLPSCLIAYFPACKTLPAKCLRCLHQARLDNLSNATEANDGDAPLGGMLAMSGGDLGPNEPQEFLMSGSSIEPEGMFYTKSRCS